ncbi:hypothetical protein BCO_0900027 (plasmid) [Borrelia coriaceae ATCC 43381]|uniref:Uncharacterized protein n=1 Tax=Borrelia coriaceae ATCC 43381 TaxID=1408429 RepID=W5SV91_9SPIR|nr:hypothetical protein BCO_0900027 [Borrelia coriaceae ATCC 43381]
MANELKKVTGDESKIQNLKEKIGKIGVAIKY